LSSKEITVLVTGVGGGSLGRELLKAFSMAKQKYRIISADMSKYSLGLHETKNHYITPSALSPDYLEKLNKICKIENIQAIAAGSEQEIEQISKNSKVFEENGIVVLSNPINIIELCSDKFTIMDFLSKKGISCPKTILFKNKSDIKKIGSFPVIIKPRKGAGSRNVFIAYDESDAVFFCNYLNKYGSNPIIQEYLENSDEEFTIGVLYADDGRLITSIAMKRFLKGGLSTRQITVNPFTDRNDIISSGISQGFFEDFLDVREFGITIAKAIGANGPINIQCRRQGKQIIPFEINPRFSGTTAVRSMVGHNEPDILCRYRLFDEIPKKIEIKKGYVFRDLSEKFISNDTIEKIPRI